MQIAHIFTRYEFFIFSYADEIIKLSSNKSTFTKKTPHGIFPFHPGRGTHSNIFISAHSLMFFLRCRCLLHTLYDGEKKSATENSPIRDKRERCDSYGGHALMLHDKKSYTF